MSKMVGVRVYYKNENDIVDDYDPIREEDIKEYPDYISITSATNIKYIFPKNLIEKLVIYPLCDDCGHELTIDHICNNIDK
jgi:hypothetical protein